MVENMQQRASAQRPAKKTWFGRLVKFLTAPAAFAGGLALCDQAIVSGTSFLATLLIGRLVGAEELGVYRLGFTVVLLGNLLQQTLVTTPYMVHLRRVEPHRRREFAGSALLHVLLLSVLVVVGLLIGNLLIVPRFASPSIGPVLWVLSLTVPFLLLRDFARNYAFAQLKVGAALRLDAAIALGQVIGLAILLSVGGLTAARALSVAGISALLGVLPWLWVRRGEFDPSRRAARAEFSRSWRFAKWLLSARIASYVSSELAIVWLLAVVLGEAAAGIYAACETIALLANPVVLGLGQYFTPRIARSYAEGGARQLRAEVWRSNALLGGMLAVFSLSVMCFGGALLRAFYGAAYVGHHATVVMLSIAIVADTCSMSASKGLWVLDRPDLDLVARGLGLAVTAVVATTLISSAGVFGVAVGMCLGCIADAIARCAFFHRQVGSEVKREDPHTALPLPCATVHP